MPNLNLSVQLYDRTVDCRMWLRCHYFGWNWKHIHESKLLLFFMYVYLL